MLQEIKVLSPAGGLRLHLIQRPSKSAALPKGMIWSFDRAGVSKWAVKPGCYVWYVCFRGEKIARYVGVGTSNINERLGCYWVDMTPQLIERHPLRRNRAHTVKHSPRYEKSDLRWVHLWLAWAALAEGASVELDVLPAQAGELPVDQERRLRGPRPSEGLLSLNKEHLPVGKASLCTAYMDYSTWSTAPSLNAQGTRYSTNPVPPDWEQTKGCWKEAIDSYISEREQYRRERAPKPRR